MTHLSSNFKIISIISDRESISLKTQWSERGRDEQKIGRS